MLYYAKYLNQMLNKIFPYVCIIFFSCVEHTFYVKVLPTGSYQVRYNAHGDKSDLTDNDFPLPTGEAWIINSSMDLIDAESYDYSANRVFMRNEFFPITFFKGDTIYFKSLLKHPLHISHSNWIFWETYEFDGLFQGRSVQSKYPAVGQLVISPDAPPKGWASEGAKNWSRIESFTGSANARKSASNALPRTITTIINPSNPSGSRHKLRSPSKTAFSALSFCILSSSRSSR